MSKIEQASEQAAFAARLEWMAPRLERLVAGSAEGSVPGANSPDFSQADPVS